MFKMATRVNSLEDLKKIPLGEVFYAKQSALGIQADWYDVGIMIQNTLPEAIKGAIKRGFETLYEETYNFKEMQDMRNSAEEQTDRAEWDRKFTTWIRDYDAPEGRLTVAAQAPVPENGRLASNFAEMLEKKLKKAK